MKGELFYGRLDPERLTVEELKTLVWWYFLSYWNRQRICSANGGLPLAVKCQRYFAALGVAA
jgi:putative transposase